MDLPPGPSAWEDSYEAPYEEKSEPQYVNGKRVLCNSEIQ